MPALQRLTTEYIDSEDRLRISGETVAGELQSFWLTQRLLLRLIRFLVDSIEESQLDSTNQGAMDARTSALFNEIAQGAALQSLPNEDPVQSTPVDATWIATDVDIANADTHITLRFKNGTKFAAEVAFDQQQLRQWLAIVFKLWELAEWPLTVWPDWIQTTAQTAADSKKSSSVH